MAAYKQTLSGSIGAGMKSLIGGSGRRYYVLEHKVASAYHKAGESQRIIVDQIELGRDPKCQVRFDESFKTVSRRHAAIVKEGDGWKLVQISQTNSTLLNGKRVEREWFLQNGDEIQLSTNGPKLGFLVPQGEKGLVRSIGLTARMNLFRKQALRPYKTSITVLACIFIAAIGLGIWALMGQNKVIALQDKALAEYKELVAKEQAVKDSLLNNLKITNESLAADNYRIKQRLREVESRRVAAPTVKASVDNAAIDVCLPDVYYVVTDYFDVVMPDGETGKLIPEETGIGWSGSGFLLDNGKFVTARHVVEGWNFWQDVNDNMASLNKIANNGGKVTVHLVAYSSTGKQIEFSSDQFTIDRSNDQFGTVEDGSKMSRASLDDTDYAFIEVDSSDGGLAFDGEKSRNLARGEALTVLGFPLGLGVGAAGVDPVYGNAIVASRGLQNGVILTTDTNYEQGNSGGPVFYTDASGRLVVVGIVSAGAGRNVGFVVPISKIR